MIMITPFDRSQIIAGRHYLIDLSLLFTMGNGITGDTPLDSLRALFEEVFAYGTKIANR